MFIFTPLLGAQDVSPAVQSLLEFDGGVKVLVDVGWDEEFDARKLKELERQVPTISLILLTHPTLSHLGAFVHCWKHVPLFNRIPVYATSPVISLGRSLIQDLYDSTACAASTLPSSAFSDASLTSSLSGPDELSHILLPRPTNDEISSAFSSVHPLKYSQPHQPLPSPFSPPLEGLTITAYAAGHTLGGTIWSIQHHSETIVYAVDWNQARENTLASAAWLSGSGATSTEVIEQLRNPSTLVCSSNGAKSAAVSGGWKKRDELLLSYVRATVAKGGSVLIPCDPSARVLELSYLLEQAWTADGETMLKQAKLYLVSKTCRSTMKYARSMLEWMDDSIVREFEARDTRNRTDAGRNGPDNSNKSSSPFSFSRLSFIDRKAQLDRALAGEGPKVFLASDWSFEWGFSADILRVLAVDQRNSVIFTNRARLPSQSAMSKLWRQIGNISATGYQEPRNLKDVNASITRSTTEALGPNELALYQQYLARQQQRMSAIASDKVDDIENPGDAADDNASESSSSDESDAGRQGRAMHASATLQHSKQNKAQVTDEELGINLLLRRKHAHDYEVSGKRGRERMYPYMAKRRRNDGFGEIVRPEEYLRAEERTNAEGDDGNDLTKKGDTTLGQKRRWDGTLAKDSKGTQRYTNGADERLRTGDAAGVADGNVPSSNGVDGDNESDNDEDEEQNKKQQEAAAGPSKLIRETDSFPMQLSIGAVDYSGVHDQRSLQMLIPLIKPRKLVITAGSAAESSALEEDCRRVLAPSAMNKTKTDQNVNVFAPVNGEAVDASVDTSAWTLTLSRDLFQHLVWQQLRGRGIATVNGQLSLTTRNPEGVAATASNKRLKTESGIKTNPDHSTQPAVDPSINPPTLNSLPPNYISTTRLASSSLTQTTHVGDLRLAELRRLLQTQGHRAEFRGEGALLVDEIVVVRKNGVGRIDVEAAATPTAANATAGALGVGVKVGGATAMMEVKGKIYEGLAVVAAR